MKKTSQQIFHSKRISSFKNTLAILGLVVMAGCNGGGAGNTEVAGLESDLMTGQFIDGPVRGVNYECSSGRFGVTNSQGQYTCKKNDTVSFKIDNVTLGTADAEAILTPVSLYPEDTEVAVNIAQLLQTLDDDGDLTSFVIDEEKAALLDASLDVTSTSFDTDAGTMLSTPLVDEATAVTHLNESITTLATMEPAPIAVATEPVSVATPLPTVSEPAPVVVQTTSSVKTKWGFQPFSIPADSITVKAGGNIQAAINSLPNGGTVRLAEGTYNISTAIILKSNTVLDGAGRDKTLIKLNGVGRVINIDGNIAAKNVIIRNLAVDATGNGANNAVEVWHGTDNVLFENMEIYGSGKSNLIAGWSGTSERITYRNIISHDSTLHGLALYRTHNCLIVDSESYNVTYYGIDSAQNTYTEISNNHIHDTGYGTKYPGATKIYLHDNLIENNKMVGISPQKRQSITGLIYMQLENNTVINSGSGIIDWSDGSGEIPPTFEQLVVIGNSMSGNTQNNIRIRGAKNLYEYGNNIGKTVLSAGSIGNLVQNQSGTPKADNVGWTSWGNP